MMRWLLGLTLFTTTQIEAKRMSPEDWAEKAYQQRVNTPDNQALLDELYSDIENLEQDIKSCPLLQRDVMRDNNKLMKNLLKKLKQEIPIKTSAQKKQFKTILKTVYQRFIHLDNEVKTVCQGIAV